MRLLARLLILAVLAGASAPCARAAPLDNPTVGGGLGVQVKHDKTTEADLDRIAALGFGYVRFDMRWASVEKTRAAYDWAQYDAFLAALRARRLKAVVILSGGNAAYSGLVSVAPDKFWGASQVAPSPVGDEAVHGFAAFAAAAAQRYKDDAIVWEIWNEPDWGGFWAPAPDADAYAALADAACRAIRAADENAAVIAPGFARFPVSGGSESGFAATFLQSPAAACLDAVSVHPYRAGDQVPESVIADYAGMRDFIAAHTPQGQKPLPVTSSEWGYTLTKATPEQQAAYVLRARLSDMLAELPLSVWYEWKDSPESKPGDAEGHFGLIDAEGHDKESLRAVAKILPALRDAVIERRVAAADREAYIVQLRRPDGSHPVLIWSARRHAGPQQWLRVSGAGGARIYPLTMQPRLIEETAAPAQIDLVSGKGSPP